MDEPIVVELEEHIVVPDARQSDEPKSFAFEDVAEVDDKPRRGADFSLGESQKRLFLIDGKLHLAVIIVRCCHGVDAIAFSDCRDVERRVIEWFMGEMW